MPFVVLAASAMFPLRVTAFAPTARVPAVVLVPMVTSAGLALPMVKLPPVPTPTVPVKASVPVWAPFKAIVPPVAVTPPLYVPGPEIEP